MILPCVVVVAIIIIIIHDFMSHHPSRLWLPPHKTQRMCPMFSTCLCMHDAVCSVCVCVRVCVCVWVCVVYALAASNIHHLHGSCMFIGLDQDFQHELSVCLSVSLSHHLWVPILCTVCLCDQHALCDKRCGGVASCTSVSTPQQVRCTYHTQYHASWIWPDHDHRLC
jgi:hypothetical protein